MNTFIVSDLHIGSKFFLYDRFDKFLDNLPDKSTLILNGDTLNDPYHTLTPHHLQILTRIIDRSLTNEVIWIYGNHDDGLHLHQSGKIQFKHNHRIEMRLYITHGHYFDNIMPYNSLFIKLFNILHHLRIKIGASPVHIAQYAKKWSFCYQYLRKNVMMNAIEFCRENGYKAITCGHVHFAEDATVECIRYINTGSWTENDPYCLHVTDTSIELRKNIEIEEISASH